MDMVSSFLHKVQKTDRINVRECTPGLDLLRHYGNETSGGALSARHLIRPVSNYVENGPPMNRKRVYQNLFLLSRQKNQKNRHSRVKIHKLSVHHNKNELIVEVGEQDKKIYRIGRNELNKTS